MRLIDADYAIKMINIAETQCGENFESDSSHIRDFLRVLPTIDPKDLIPKGQWIERDCFVYTSDGEPVCKIGSVFVCSECGREERYKEPFCHCGANMRE